MINNKIKKVILVIESGKYSENIELIKDAIQDPKVSDFVAGQLDREYSDLKEIDFILSDLMLKYSGTMFNILHKSISKDNADYILNFIDENFDKFIPSENIRLDPDHWILEILSTLLKKLQQYSGEIFKLVKRIIEAQDFKQREDIDFHQIQMLGDILVQLFNVNEDNNTFRDKIVATIFQNFDVIRDQGKYHSYTPPQIFTLLKGYLISDFVKHFEIIKTSIITQYDEQYEDHAFDGFDSFGWGISSINDKHTLEDNLYVEEVFAPAILDYYNQGTDKKAAWKYLVDLCVSSNISRDNPDFLNRAILPLLIEQYSSEQKSEEAFSILKKFIVRHPKKSTLDEYIFYQVANSDLSDEKKWKIVRIAITENKVQNDFVEQIILETALNGHTDAKKYAVGLLKDENYLMGRNRWRERRSLYFIERLLSAEDEDLREAAFEAISNSMARKKEREGIDEMRIANFSREIGILMNKEYTRAFDFLKDLIAIEEPTNDQQTLLFDSFHKIEKKVVQKKAYDELLEPLLLEHKDIKSFSKKYTHSYARQNIIEFAENLAKSNYFEESLFIVKFFLEDENPTIHNAADDKDGQFNYHKRIARGEEEITITSVRGYIPWVLQKFVGLGGREYIPEILQIIEKLTKDENYYIRVQATVPLIELARVRLMVMPEDSSQNFIENKKDIEKIEAIAFSMLRSEENRSLKAVMKHLVHVFNYIRNLDNKQAVEVLGYFKESKFSSVRSEAAPLFIFYAEYRKTAYKDKKWEYLGEFDDKPFKNILETILLEDNKNVRNTFAWQLWKLAKVEDDDKRTAADKKSDFDSALKYMKILSSRYEADVYDDVFRFIEDHIDQYFDECFDLLMQCLVNEKEILEKKDSEKTIRGFDREVVMKAIMGVKGRDDELISAMDIITQYPKESTTYLLGGLKEIVEYFVKSKSSNKKVQKILQRLAEVNQMYAIKIEEWKSED